MNPRISIIIPVRNEADRVSKTVSSLLDARSTDVDLEIIIVDDASTDGCCSNLASEALSFCASGVRLRVFRLNDRLGVPGARNQGVQIADGEISFITDAHVRFCKHWDRYVLDNIRPKTILAATIGDSTSAFKAYGCSLIVPFMGTKWNRVAPEGITSVQIASSAGTILPTALFHEIGGYDSGMRIYSGAEPEFSVRAWLSGAEIVSVPQLEVIHYFKPKEHLDAFLEGLRPFMIHNSLRFGLLYLSELAILQQTRYFALSFPDEVQEAFRMVEDSNVWQRREFLETKLKYNFTWFVNRFDLKDQVDQAILM